MQPNTLGQRSRPTTLFCTFLIPGNSRRRFCASPNSRAGNTLYGISRISAETEWGTRDITSSAEARKLSRWPSWNIWRKSGASRRQWDKLFAKMVVSSGQFSTGFATDNAIHFTFLGERRRTWMPLHSNPARFVVRGEPVTFGWRCIARAKRGKWSAKRSRWLKGANVWPYGWIRLRYVSREMNRGAKSVAVKRMRILLIGTPGCDMGGGARSPPGERYLLLDRYPPTPIGIFRDIKGRQAGGSWR